MDTQINVARTAPPIVEATPSSSRQNPISAMPSTKPFLPRRDPELAKAFTIYLKNYIGGLFMVSLVIFAVFSIYWGSLWKIPDHPLKGLVVDFDGAEIGESVVSGLTSNPTRAMMWSQASVVEFPRGHDDVVQAMQDERTWAIVAINEGASARLSNSLSSPDAFYNGSGAITSYGNEARNENAYRILIRPTIDLLLQKIQQQFATELAKSVSNSSNLAFLMSISPQTIAVPISYTVNNVIPFDQPVASAATFVGLIYLLILTFFIVMIGNGAREASRLECILTLRSFIVLRIGSSFAGYFFLSLFYSLLNLAFQLHLTRKFGRAGFMVFWMLNWVGMLAVGLALESLLPLITVRFIPFFLILWIIADVSVCIYPIPVLPHIYRYGYAAPFYNISRASRAIAFGTKNEIGLNFGILLGWVAVSCLTLPAIQWFFRKKQSTRAVSGNANDCAIEKEHI